VTHIKPTNASGPGLASQDERLRGVVKQLEGVFVEQLYKAMRQTVPDDGITHGGAGEEMFAGLLDQHLASETPKQWNHGLGDALVAQLRPALARQAHVSADPLAPVNPDTPKGARQ
jgi:flagellar protein FlgJ